MKECISRSVKTAFELHTTRLQEYGSSLSLSRENSDGKIRHPYLRNAFPVLF